MSDSSPLVDPESSASNRPGDAASIGDATLWVDQYGDALFRFSVARVSNRELAEELVQETFLAAISAQSSFRSESSVSTWLFSILRRKIADHFRVLSRRGKTESFDDALDVPPAPSEARLRRANDPMQVYEDKEFWKTFDACVEKLPNKLAEVFALREVSQYSPKEICELLGLSATNLSMRLHRSRLALKDCLNQNWFHEE